MGAFSCDFVVVVAVAVVPTRPRAIPLAMITMRKSIPGFPLLSSMGMGHRLAALRATGAPLLRAPTHTQVLNRTDETNPGRRSCPRLQFLAFCFDYHVVVTLSSLCSNQSCLIVIRFLFWGDQIYHRSYVY